MNTSRTHNRPLLHRFSSALLIGALGATGILGALPAIAHDKEDQLGRVTFATSCNPKAHAQFVTGVAMLHSYWFGEARKTFEAALVNKP